jgi:holo-[acyl-carrier protein] synthase
MDGVGIDLLEIDRLERALTRRPNLAARLFTQGERARAEGSKRPGSHLAARFCAKEAVTKALALDALRPQEIEVIGGGGSAPHVLLHGAARRRAEALGVEIAISLTHTHVTAGAVAVARRAA